jgi:hypothetical protein
MAPVSASTLTQVRAACLAGLIIRLALGSVSMPRFLVYLRQSLEVMKGRLADIEELSISSIAFGLENSFGALFPGLDLPLRFSCKQSVVSLITHGMNNL